MKNFALTGIAKTMKVRVIFNALETFRNDARTCNAENAV